MVADDEIAWIIVCYTLYQRTISRDGKKSKTIQNEKRGDEEKKSERDGRGKDPSVEFILAVALTRNHEPISERQMRCHWLVCMCAKGTHCLPIRNTRNACASEAKRVDERRCAHCNSSRRATNYSALWKNCSFARPFCRILFTVQGFHEANRIVTGYFSRSALEWDNRLRDRITLRWKYRRTLIAWNKTSMILYREKFLVERTRRSGGGEGDHMNQNSGCLN